MGIYANPVERVMREARQLNSGTYPQLTAQLKDGEALGAVYDRFVFKQAPNLFSEREMAEFEQQVSDGRIMRVMFFALPTDSPLWDGGNARKQQ